MPAMTAEIRGKPTRCPWGSGQGELTTRGPEQARPLLQHKVIAISLILVVAAAVQIGTWHVSSRLFPGSAGNKVCKVMAHGLLFDGLNQTVSSLAGGGQRGAQAMFAACLLIALGSAVAWYAAARLALGVPWGLWTGLFWVTHPLPALLAQRPSSLTFLMLLVPASWATLRWWMQSPRPLAALLAGVCIGLVTLVSIQGFLLLVAGLAVMLAGAGFGRSTCLGVLVAGLGFATPVASAWALLHHGGGLERMSEDLASGWWEVLDTGDGSEMAREARRILSSAGEVSREPALRFIAGRLGRCPRATLGWSAQRLGRTLYTTEDHRFERPLFVLQVLWLVPAVWGWLIAFGYPPWRPAAATAMLFVVVTWTFVGLAEPVARNLAPVGGMGIVFGLVGVADVYERLFGRRLTQPRAAARPGGRLGGRSL